MIKKLLSPSFTHGRKNLTWLINDFCLSEGYFFAKATIEKSNNQYHEQEWLVALDMLSYMLEFNENVAILSILQFWNLLSLLTFTWNLKFYFLHDKVGTTLKHPKTTNGNIKNLS